MYEYNNIPEMQENAEDCVSRPVKRYGVQIYHDEDADWSGSSFVIDPADVVGLAIYREFCKKMSEHYKSLIK